VLNPGAKEYRGLMSLEKTEAYARRHLHLPRFGQRAGHGIFSGGDALLATVEEAYLHLFQLRATNDNLEKQLARVMKRLTKLEKVA
jgi:hypothetical protein